MDNYIPVLIDGEELYISGFQSDGYDSFSLRQISSDALKLLLKPVSKIGQAFRSGLKSMEPDEVEMTMQFTMGMENDKLFLGLAKQSAEAQISVKCAWKNDKKKCHNGTDTEKANSFDEVGSE